MKIPRLLRRWGLAVFFGLLVLMMSVLGFSLIFSTFANYDDEGLVLYALHHFLESHALYDEVYTQYGPGYFFLHGLLLRGLYGSVTHNNLRLISLLFWLLGSLALSLAVYRMTRHVASAAIALLASFIVASAIIREPGHPQAMLYGLVSLGIFLASYPSHPWRWGLLGALAGLCFFTKANVGAFLFLSLMGVMLNGIPWRRGGSLLRIAFGFGLVFVPLILMRSRFENAATLNYAIAAAVTNFNVFLLSRSLNSRRENTWEIPQFWAALGALCLGFSAAGVLSAGVALAGGTTPTGLYQGVIGQHLGFDRVFWLNPPFKGWTILLNAFLSLLGCLLYTQRGRWKNPIFFQWSSRVAKGLLAAVIIYLAMRVHFGLALHYRAALPMPWIWLLLLSPPRQALKRYTLVAIAALQFLVAYPVAGSQLAFACVLLVPIGCILLRDAVAEVEEIPSLRAIASAGVILITIMAIATLSYRTLKAVQQYNDGQAPIALAGSSLLRLPEAELATYEGLTLNLRAQADALLTLPGMYSFCLWSGVDSPTLKNQTNWPFAFDDATQNAIAQKIASIPKVAVIRNDRLVGFWGKEAAARSSPLVRYIDRNFVPIAVMGHYQLLASKQNSSNSRIIGAQWDVAQLPEISKQPLPFVRVNLPTQETQLHRLEVYNLTTQTPVAIQEFVDGTNLAIIEKNGTLKKMKAVQLERQGLDLTQPRQILLPLASQPQASSKEAYVLRGFDASDRLLFRLPFLELDV